METWPHTVSPKSPPYTYRELLIYTSSTWPHTVSPKSPPYTYREPLISYYLEIGHMTISTKKKIGAAREQSFRTDLDLEIGHMTNSQYGLLGPNGANTWYIT
jgi:hypothetical protein